MTVRPTTLRTTAFAAFALCLVAALCACAAGRNQVSITIAGSTALLPLVKQAAIDYQTQHPNVKISVSGGGSMTGIAQAAQKGVDIGDSDVVPLNESGLMVHKIAVATFGVVVNPAAGVTNLTMRQIRDVFSGKIVNWRQVGGSNQSITIVNRPRSSGTRAVFVEKIMKGAQPSESGLTQDSSGTVAAMVAQTPGAASYLAMSYLKPGQDAVSIDGVAATRANVENGRYAFWSYELMLTNGRPSTAAAHFIDFVRTDEELLSELGFIPVSRMKNPER